MSGFVNHEGHEGTRSKMPQRLIDGLLGCVALSLVLSVIAPQAALAGGPRYVAGVSYFDPSTKGTPLTWSQGVINYYTDQGISAPYFQVQTPTPSLPTRSAAGHRFQLQQFHPHWPGISLKM